MTESSHAAPTNVSLPEDWDQVAADRLFSTVDTARTKITGPAITVARSSVYGLLAVILIVIAAIVALIGLVRLLDVILPWSVWLVYLVLGITFTGIGLFLWSKRPKDAAG